MRYASEKHSLQRIFPITAPLHWKCCQGQYICCYCYCYCFTLTQISCSMVEVRKCQQKSKWQDARKHPGKQKILIFLQVEIWLTFTVIFNSYNNNNIGTWSESRYPLTCMSSAGATAIWWMMDRHQSFIRKSSWHLFSFIAGFLGLDIVPRIRQMNNPDNLLWQTTNIRFSKR